MLTRSLSDYVAPVVELLMALADADAAADVAAADEHEGTNSAPSKVRLLSLLLSKATACYFVKQARTCLHAVFCYIRSIPSSGLALKTCFQFSKGALVYALNELYLLHVCPHVCACIDTRTASVSLLAGFRQQQHV